ncbi:PHP domain-containing protein [Eubacteriales bacterium KG127]
MEYKVDYHFHSNFSDGNLKPLELVKWYKDNGYDEIALTDHDGIDGIAEAKIAGEALGIQVISGIELSTNLYCDFKKEPLDVHLLGYRFDEDNDALNAKLKELRQFRKNRNDKILEKLKEMGYNISHEDTLDRPKQTYVGKPNIARALLKKGYIENIPEAFEKGKFLESPEIKNIKKEKMTTEEAIKLVKGAGGTAVIAHPMEIFAEESYFVTKEDFFSWFEGKLKELKRVGLGGIECYHPSADEEDSRMLFEIAARLKMHVTRGSDYHGIE